MKKNRTSKNPIKVPKAKADDLPATRRMLKLVRTELKEELSAVEKRLTAKIEGVNADISELKASVARTNVLVEEQNANNRIVLEGLQALWQRQDAFEKKTS